MTLGQWAGGICFFLVVIAWAVGKVLEAIEKLNSNLSGLRRQIENMQDRQTIAHSDLSGIRRNTDPDSGAKSRGWWNETFGADTSTPSDTEG